jgi:hypothetical protein
VSQLPCPAACTGKPTRVACTSCSPKPSARQASASAWPQPSLKPLLVLLPAYLPRLPPPSCSQRRLCLRPVRQRLLVPDGEGQLLHRLCLHVRLLVERLACTCTPAHAQPPPSRGCSCRFAPTDSKCVACHPALLRPLSCIRLRSWYVSHGMSVCRHAASSGRCHTNQLFVSVPPLKPLCCFCAMQAGCHRFRRLCDRHGIQWRLGRSVSTACC